MDREGLLLPMELPWQETRLGVRIIQETGQISREGWPPVVPEGWERG